MRKPKSFDKKKLFRSKNLRHSFEFYILTCWLWFRLGPKKLLTQEEDHLRAQRSGVRADWSMPYRKDDVIIFTLKARFGQRQRHDPSKGLIGPRPTKVIIYCIFYLFFFFYYYFALKSLLHLIPSSSSHRFSRLSLFQFLFLSLKWKREKSSHGREDQGRSFFKVICLHVCDICYARS